MKILVFGAGGFVGGRLVQAALACDWQVIAVTRNPLDTPFPKALHAVCDITDADQVNHLLASAAPHIAFNLAAASNIDMAEKDPERTFQVNVNGAAHVARACSKLKIRFIHFTSDAVFDGQVNPIRENDEPHPLNIYGKTKAAGDSEVTRLCPSAAIVRISLAVGFPVQRGNSFLAMIKNRLSQGTEVYAPEDEIRTPVDIRTLCEASLELAHSGFAGIMNIGSTESIDRYSLTSQLAQALGYSPELVRRSGTPLPGRAARHKLGIMDVGLACRTLYTPMLNIQKTIRQSIKEFE